MTTALQICPDFRGIFEKGFPIFAEISIGKRPQFKSRIVTNFQFIILIFCLCWWDLLKRDDNKKKFQTLKSSTQEEEGLPLNI